MLRNGVSFIILSLALIAPVQAEKTVASVDGTNITESMVETYAMQRGAPSMAAVSPEQRKQLINELIDRELLYKVALKQGLDKSPEVKKELDSANRNILASAVIRDLSDGKNAITDEILQEEFNTFIKTVDNAEFKARHILLETEADAKAVIAQLDKGEDFQKLAKEKSTGPSAGNGGDLGWFRPEQMVAPFSAAVKSLAKGSYSKTPVQTDFGWHVILLEDSRSIDPPSFSSIKEQLRQKVQNERIGKYLQDLRNSAKIEQK